MRKRKEIEEQTQVGPINEYVNGRVTVELLLDIRDLLQPEISSNEVPQTESPQGERCRCGAKAINDKCSVTGEYLDPTKVLPQEKLDIRKLLEEYADERHSQYGRLGMCNEIVEILKQATKDPCPFCHQRSCDGSRHVQV